MLLLDLGRQPAPEWSALAAILVLLVALALLYLSMRRHLKKARETDLPMSHEVRGAQASRREPSSPTSH